jgi:hypothetical protein
VESGQLLAAQERSCGPEPGVDVKVTSGRTKDRAMTILIMWFVD